MRSKSTKSPQLLEAIPDENQVPSANWQSPVEHGSLVEEILESTTDSVFVLDFDWRFIYLNAHARGLISGGKSLLGTCVWDEFPHAVHSGFWEPYHRTMEQRVPTTFVSYYPEPIDSWFEVHAFPTKKGISAFFRDITKRLQEEEQLRLLEQAVASAPMGITLARFKNINECPLIYVNPAFEALTGYSYEEAIGADCRFLQGSDIEQSGRAELHSALEKGRPAKALLRNYKKNGQQFFNEVHLSQVYDKQGKVTHVVGIQNDVSDQLETKAKLARQAEYDALTGLANRYLLLDRLKAAFADATTNRSQVAIVILDLDNFKHMNDRLGHVEADRLLVQIARRLRAAAAPRDTVARLGGDEFALILTTWSDQGRLQKQMEKLLSEIRKPVLCGDQEIMVTGSAGVAIFPNDSRDAEALMQMADLSMYWIKRCGKNSFRLYGPELRFNDNEPLDVAVGFRKALLNGEFELHYQSRVDAKTKRVVGFEALIRWRHPERGLLLPAQFVRVAEDTGLINEIGKWVLEEALRQNAAWRAEGLEPISMSVNVSPAQIRDPHFADLVAETLHKAGLPPHSLELELTESLLIDNAEVADASLRALKALGVRIAIDDFGAGYSGLHYLSRFPVDTIKIDHFFTRNIATNKTAATICRSVLKLGQSLGLQTVAEGVETQAQATLLRHWRCSEMQGYMFARPLPGDEARRSLQSFNETGLSSG